ncbi:MAG: hypothetical protein KF718_15735 [Polyangiaceae bacterium]|nr:hypothetical protein [Polyangiaceae bacterium]
MAVRGLEWTPAPRCVITCRALDDETAFQLLRVQRVFDMDADQTLERVPSSSAPDTIRDLAPPAFDAPRTLDELTLPQPPAARRHASTPPVAITMRPATSTSLGPVVFGVMVAMSGAAAAGVIVAGALSRTPAPARAHVGLAAVRVPAVVAPAAPGIQSCEAAEAVRLASQLPPGAAVEVISGSRGFAVGFPTSQRSGLGLQLDPTTLAVTRRDELTDLARVGGVMPRADGSFSVDRYAVGLMPTFSVGMTPRGFARLAADGGVEVVWPGQANEVITRPVSAAAPGVGHLVAFRRGEPVGTLRAGWLDEQGLRRSELRSVGESLSGVSSPAVAVSAARAVLAFAASGPGGERQLYAAAVGVGEPPTEAVALGFDAGQSPRAVALSSLEGGRFLLAWVSGQGAERALSGAVLDDKLTLVGEVTRWAALSEPVVTTALVASGARAAVLSVRAVTSSRHELWGQTLGCR